MPNSFFKSVPRELTQEHPLKNREFETQIVSLMLDNSIFMRHRTESLVAIASIFSLARRQVPFFALPEHEMEFTYIEPPHISQFLQLPVLQRPESTNIGNYSYMDVQPQESKLEQILRRTERETKRNHPNLFELFNRHDRYTQTRSFTRPDSNFAH